MSLKYALLAQAAYSEKPTFGDENSAARAIVSNNDDGQVISIPGTDNIACFLADLDIETITVNGLGRMHSGFYEAFLEMKSQLMLCAPSVITGHSLGAALSLIYAAELCLAGKPPKAVYAFEPPRISTDSVIAELLASHGVSLHLTQFGQDIVPMIPRILHDWQHPSWLIKIGRPHLTIPNVHDHSIDNVVKWYSEN